MDIMETQYKDVQGKENKEDVVKLVEIVIEEYVKVPNKENVLDENVKDLDAEEYGKDTEGRRLLCDIFFVTAANKRNSQNFAMKRYGEKEILKKSVKVKKMLNKRKLRKRQNLNFLKWRRTM